MTLREARKLRIGDRVYDSRLEQEGIVSAWREKDVVQARFDAHGTPILFQIYLLCPRSRTLRLLTLVEKRKGMA
jgi:hypothetical protein